MQIPKAILFDLDGTLADTAPDLAQAVNLMRIQRQLPPLPIQVLSPFASAGARGLLHAGLNIQPEHKEYDDLRDEFLSNYASAIAVHSSLFPDISQLIEYLESKHLPWGIVTNKAARFTTPLIPLLGLQNAACVISGDTTPHAKPHPAPLLEAAKQINIDPLDCWYVGDDLRDIQAGKAANMFTIAAAWGYCGNTEPNKWEAHYISNSPADLLESIQAAIGYFSDKN